MRDCYIKVYPEDDKDKSRLVSISCRECEELFELDYKYYLLGRELCDFCRGGD